MLACDGALASDDLDPWLSSGFGLGIAVFFVLPLPPPLRCNLGV